MLVNHGLVQIKDLCPLSACMFAFIAVRIKGRVVGVSHRQVGVGRVILRLCMCALVTLFLFYF